MVAWASRHAEPGVPLFCAGFSSGDKGAAADNAFQLIPRTSFQQHGAGHVLWRLAGRCHWSGGESACILSNLQSELTAQRLHRHRANETLRTSDPALAWRWPQHCAAELPSCNFCVQIGSFVFRAAVKQRSFARLDYSADFDDEIPEPITQGHVSKKLKGIMGFTDEWVRTPDYQRVRFSSAFLAGYIVCDNAPVATLI